MPSLASQIFIDLCKKADVVVAHNMAFDDLSTAAMCLRSSGSPSPLSTKLKVCTMQSATPVLKIKGKFPPAFKWPSLQEAVTHYGGGLIENAHDALADSEACLVVFRGLVESGELVLKGIVDDDDDEVEVVVDDLNEVEMMVDGLNEVEEEQHNLKTSDDPTKTLELYRRSGTLVTGGDTFKHRQNLRQMGGIWVHEKKGWYFDHREIKEAVTFFGEIRASP
jgi:DNA polymerase III epsilon subunit-like protein